MARTWALQHDVHQLSVLAGAADAGARARARRARRLAKARAAHARRGRPPVSLSTCRASARSPFLLAARRCSARQALLMQTRPPEEVPAVNHRTTRIPCACRMAMHTLCTRYAHAMHMLCTRNAHATSGLRWEPERAAQELEAAEGALADACDEVDKAERFFPAPGGADAAAQPRAAHGARAQPPAELFLRGGREHVAEQPLFQLLPI